MDEQREQHPPTDLAWGLTAFLLGFGAYYLVSLVIVGFLPAPDGPRSGVRLVAPLIANLFLGLVPWWFSRRYGRGVLADFGFLPTRRDAMVGLVCGVASVLVGLVISMLVSRIIPPQASPVTVAVWSIEPRSLGPTTGKAVSASGRMAGVRLRAGVSAHGRRCGGSRPCRPGPLRTSRHEALSVLDLSDRNPACRG